MLREGLPRDQILRDIFAGVVVGIVAFPLAIAFGIASGVRPEQGLFTAIVGGLIVSVLGGSRVQIAGPTGAFVVLVFDLMRRFGYDGLAVATVMAGILLIAMGAARLGAVIRFVPYPVTVGFTTGIACIIALGQVRDALGLRIEEVPAEFFARLEVLAQNVSTLQPAAVGVAVSTVVIIFVWPRLTGRVPGMLTALVATTIGARLLDLPVETIGSRFGSVPTHLPAPRLPDFHVDAELLPQLVSAAVAIALLGGIESLLSAVVADGMTGRRHRSNVELMAQGAANVVSPFFGGIPVTGAIARTATNVKNGGRTPLAGIVHSLTLVLILLLAGKWAALIPMATLAGILVVVAYNMSEWRHFLALFRGPRSDALVLVVTFLLTVLVDLAVAIQVGVVLAALLFMRRMAEVSEVKILGCLDDDEEAEGRHRRRDVPPGVEVFEIRGAFFFGSVQTFSDVLARLEVTPKVVILRMREVVAIDATALRSLTETIAGFEREGTVLLLSGVGEQPLRALRLSGLAKRLGEDHLHATFADALDAARQLVFETGSHSRLPDELSGR